LALLLDDPQVDLRSVQPPGRPGLWPWVSRCLRSWPQSPSDWHAIHPGHWVGLQRRWGHRTPCNPHDPIPPAEPDPRILL